MRNLRCLPLNSGKSTGKPIEKENQGTRAKETSQRNGKRVERGEKKEKKKQIIKYEKRQPTDGHKENDRTGAKGDSG